MAAPVRGGAPLVLAGAVLWGTSGSSQELLGGAVTPIVVGSLRTVLGGLVLAIFALRTTGRDRMSLETLADARIPLALAGVCIAAYQVTFFIGVQQLGIAVGTILAIGASPFAAGAASMLVGQGRPSRAWLATTSLAVLGLVLLVQPDGDARVALPGVLAALTAGGSFGAFTVVTKGLLARGLRRVDTVASPFVVAGVMLLPVLVVGLLGSEDPAALVRIPGLLVVLWLSIGATAVGYLFFIVGLRTVTAVVGATLVLAEPLTAALLGVLVFAERLSLTAVVGALLVATALLLTAARPDLEPAR